MAPAIYGAAFAVVAHWFLGRQAVCGSPALQGAARHRGRAFPRPRDDDLPGPATGWILARDDRTLLPAISGWCLSRPGTAHVQPDVPLRLPYVLAGQRLPAGGGDGSYPATTGRGFTTGQHPSRGPCGPRAAGCGAARHRRGNARL